MSRGRVEAGSSRTSDAASNERSWGVAVALILMGDWCQPAGHDARANEDRMRVTGNGHRCRRYHAFDQTKNSHTVSRRIPEKENDLLPTVFPEAQGGTSSSSGSTGTLGPTFGRSSTGSSARLAWNPGPARSTTCEPPGRLNWPRPSPAMWSATGWGTAKRSPPSIT
jgi:hypothetical protein